MASSRRDYVSDKATVKDFVLNFRPATAQPSDPPHYMAVLQAVANRETREVNVSLEDLMEFTGGNTGLADAVAHNTARYLTLFQEAIDEVLPEPTANVEDADIVDVLMHQRRERANAAGGSAAGGAGGGAGGAGGDDGAGPSVPEFPPAMRRRYELRFIPPSKKEVMGIREAGAEQIGSLITLSGVVTRITEVKPLIQVATYTCDVCGFEIYQEVTGRTFMPVAQCPSERCRANNTRGKLYMQTRGSKFVKFQEMRLQELSSQVPVGHVPRSITIHLKGSLTRVATAGDTVEVTGIFLPISYTGFRQIRAGLVADTFSYAETAKDAVSDDAVATLAADSAVYSKLAKSIAPEIFGMEDVKKALLLLLVGGVSRNVRNSMKIRGELNVCLMGDPGVAKSQLLKYISRLTPRGVYTTGKGSSGVGLTAAVIRDKTTGEVSLEGGALVLADMGVCCIDEFDKMDESDRTAIHEVMEQQTISIAKAGIITTLNARTSILAAANPVMGRYNRRLSPTENINLPAALLSRFDLVFLLLDTPDVDKDQLLAQHICYVHREAKAPPLDFEPYDPALIRAYVARARECNPVVPDDLASYVVSTYVGMRENEARRKELHGHTSARTLLGVLRLAQALARLRFADVVTKPDVDEAVRLMHMSKASLTSDSSSSSGLDPKSAIYTIIRDEDARRGHSQTLRYDDILPLVIAKGYTAALLDDVMDEYADIGVWTISSDRSTITFVS
ncbi:prolifera [Thecamonas trahens ATCC 50062]|uniref:DNA replication licensing factor MCM7 n=1 Tax=Thecamonas trahens ATCC 50062 TaxID=461836 RepID=A0A0L0DFI4_THETB|nr:prolifera [Thecamonas trahens ATCC 50062]KNC51000.1 prolifera [Thecamonas trahens ATCC 50062]|eukprot:XP_013756469.1 prolifera [Thecamonas trahens ATCC 50062]